MSSNWMSLDKRSQVYLWEPLWEQAVAVYLNKLPIGIPARGAVHFKMKTWQVSGVAPAEAPRINEVHHTDLTVWLTASGQELCTVRFSLCLGVLHVVGIHKVTKPLSDVHELWQHLKLRARTTIPNYREAARRGSMISGCCQHFCQRSRLLLWRNPAAEGKWKQCPPIRRDTVWKHFF